MSKKNLLILFFLIGTIVLQGCTITGKSVYSDCKCELTTTTANLKTDVRDDSGKGCLTDCVADVWVKNLENQPTEAQVSARCHTVDKEKTYFSEKYWLQPQGEYVFEIKVDAGMMEDWKCENFQVYPGKINDCQVK